MRPHRTALLTTVALSTLSLPACGDSTRADQALNRITLSGMRSLGLSGITRDDDGRIWAVAERDEAIYRFEQGAWPTAAARVPIGGLAPDLELESSAWLGGERVALGSERDEVRSQDVVVVARIADDTASVVDEWVVDWRALFGRDAPVNQGIEGLCAADGQLIAAGEHTWVEGGRRFAPLVRARLDDAGIQAWEPMKLLLTSRTGRISALECIASDDGNVAVFAIERHFGVTHLLRFDLPASDAPALVEPRTIADIGSRLSRIPNMEGLFFDDDRLVIVTDHDDPAEGDTESLWLTLDPRRQRVTTAGFELP
jgi:hypothetical protein